MVLHSAGMPVDLVRAESSRFRSPLVLLHGLWTGGWIWRDVAPYLAHRGWDAWIPSFVRAEAAALDLETRRAALLDLCRELPGAPIIVAHDAALAVADALAHDAKAPAVVAIAPVSAGTFASPRFWMARLGARDVRPPRGRSEQGWFAGLGEDDLARVASDSASLLRAAASASTPRSVSARGLVVASSHDPTAPLAHCKRVAEQRGWALERHETVGHFPMLARSATGLADRVHRWLVQALGHDLLAWIDDEEGDD